MRAKPSPDLIAKKMAFLKQVPVFGALKAQDLLTLTQEFQVREYRKGQIIFQQGDPSSGLYVIVRGKVRIFRLTPAGTETSINIFGPGDIIGEFATIDQQPRSATAQAITHTTLLLIAPDVFWKHLREMPDLAAGMMQLLVSKVRWTAAYAETIAQYDAAGRLLHILLLYNERFGEELEKDKRYLLDLGLNQSDLASLVGVRREWVNHLLQEWQRRGLVEYDAGKLTILDLPRVIQERDSRIEANLNSGTW